MIAVTAATGRLGHLVVEELLRRGVPAGEIVAAVRNPPKAADLADLGVEEMFRSTRRCSQARACPRSSPKSSRTPALASPAVTGTPTAPTCSSFSDGPTTSLADAVAATLKTA
jgi:hypothetical protein